MFGNLNNEGHFFYLSNNHQDLLLSDFRRKKPRLLFKFDLIEFSPFTYLRDGLLEFSYSFSVLLTAKVSQMQLPNLMVRLCLETKKEEKDVMTVRKSFFSL